MKIDRSQRNAALERYQRYAQQHELRRSSERQTIVDEVLALDSHFTVDVLHELLGIKGQRVSRATVYNTLQLLVEAQVLRKIVLGDTLECTYELATLPPHVHLMCTTCGKLKEVRDPGFVTFMNTRKYTAFTGHQYDLLVYGTCSTCARKRHRREAGRGVPKK